MGMGCQRHAPAAVSPEYRCGIHCTGGWVGRRAGLGESWKSRPLPEFDPRTAHPVESRYTDWANLEKVEVQPVILVLSEDEALCGFIENKGLKQAIHVAWVYWLMQQFLNSKPVI